MAGQAKPVKDDEWEDVWDDVPDSPAPSTVVAAPTVEPETEESMLSKGWHMLSDPLTTAPSRFARSISADIDQPVNEDYNYFTGLKARAKGFFAGATEGAGDLLSSLTSPINLATAALSGGSSLAGKTGLTSIANAASMGAKGAGALTAAHG